ncbi:MAG: hypothetical protein IT290_09005, partial [Deltaproteobacteria bacterium]|nr:hypothetical protein [Deltaproteobacteria bacterium]
RLEGKAAQYLASFAGLYGSPSPYYSPSRWLADVLSSFIGTQVVHTNEKVILLFSAAIGLTAISFLVFDLFMFRVRSASLVSEHIDESAPGVRFRRDAVRRGLERIVDFVYRDQQVRAVVLKDLTSLIRDRTQALQLALYLGIATVYVTVFYFMSLGLQLELIALQTWKASLATLNVLFSGLIFTTILTRIVFPSVSLEGRSFWILQVTPIEASHLLRAKLLCWLPLTTAMFVSLLCAGALAIGTEWNYLLYVVIFGTALSIGYTGLAIGLGARFAIFDWESPNQLAVGVGTLVLLLSGIVLLFSMTIPTGIITFFVIVPTLQEIVGRGVAFSIMAGMLALALFVNISIARYACRTGAKSLAGRKSPNS